MYRIFTSLLIALSVITVSCGSSPTEKLYGTALTVTIAAPSLSGSLTGESVTQQAAVYLPPSYAEGSESYPVVYYLHGFGGTYRDIEENFPAIDAAMHSGSVNEFIIVGVNGMNTLGGSFYANSAAAGNWEDYTVGDVVTHIDSSYRTIRNPASRGICGFSMGGFAAVNLALRHPDVYSAVWVLAPGLFDANGLADAMPIWSRDEPGFLTAYGAAFAPGTDAAEHYAQIPAFSETSADNAVVAAWANGFGNLQSKVDAYLAKTKPLTAICLEYNTADYYAWIPRGTKYLSDIFKAASITHTLTPPSGRSRRRHTDALSRKHGSVLFTEPHILTLSAQRAGRIEG